MELNFEEIYKIPFWAMNITRTHIYIPKNIKWFFQFFVLHGMCTMWVSLFIYNIFFYDIKARDFAQTCRNGTFVIIYLSTSLQCIIIFWKHDLFKNMFKIVKTDYNNAKNQSTEEQQIVLKYAKNSIWVSKCWFVMAIGGVVIFPLKNFYLHIYHYRLNGLRKIQLFELVYPVILIEENKEKMAIFVAIYLGLMVDATYCALVFIGFAPLGPYFMLHACGQLEILTKRIEIIFSTQDVTAELKNIVIELQKIYSFVEEIQNTFRVPYELILKMTVIILPITSYAIIEAFSDGEISVEFFVFITGAFLNATCPCYYSEVLMAKGDSLRMAVYSCGWERTYERRTRKMIALLLQRASRPIAIRTMFRTLNLDSLTDAIHQAYAIFNLMNAALGTD